MEFLDRIERIIMKFLRWALVFLMIAVSLSVSWGVFTRYVLNDASTWTFEFSGFCLVWITFIGTVYAIYKGNHIRFETLFDMLPRKIRLVIHTVLNASMILFVTLLTYYGFFLAIRSMGDETVSLPLTKGYFYLIVPIGGALMLIAFISDTIKAFKRGDNE